VTQQVSIGQTSAALYVVAVLFNYVWELAQMPLYEGASDFPTLWWHCGIATLGDGLLVLLIYGLGGLVFRDARWFVQPGWRGYLLMLIAGIALSISVEVSAVQFAQLWAYKPSMPLVPLFGVGLTPFAQMLLLPPLIFRVVAAGQRGSSNFRTSRES
jgi:hypothetical protein